MNTISQTFVCVHAVLLLSADLTAASEPAARKPNIILIMADDASDTVFGSYGSSHFSTPKLDALAREGLRFNHCYSVNLCVPTRVEILTGKYSHRNFLGKGTLAKGERTIAHVLKAQGYRTCLAAKWQVSVRRGQKPAEAGFDHWCYNAGPADFYWDPKIDQDGNIRSLPGEYGPDVYLDYVRQFVEDNRDRPFFVFYAMHLPHGPNHWPPAADGSRPDLPNPDEPLAQYEKMVAYCDGLVGRLLQTLDELRLREETIVLFTSDNGTPQYITHPHLGGSITGGKGQVSDNGTKVPLIVSWKGQTPKGTVTEDLVDFTDLFATFAEAADARIAAEAVDGVSFLPQIQGRPGKPRPWAFVFGSSNQGQPRDGFWARDQRWKLYGDRTLIDIAHDPNETNAIMPADDTRETESVRKRLEPVFRQLKVPTQKVKLRHRSHKKSAVQTESNGLIRTEAARELAPPSAV